MKGIVLASPPKKAASGKGAHAALKLRLCSILAPVARRYLRWMHRLFLRTPWWAPVLFPSFTWRLPAQGRTVYLSFDDGPHPTITPWVLDLLAAYQAKASFFCIGENVDRYPAVYQRIISEGHSVGNHTHRHCNGWKTPGRAYLHDVKKASERIDSKLFRPPYGKLTPRQAKGLKTGEAGRIFQVVMWDVLSADFDQRTSAVQCSVNVLTHVRPGSVVVFHDSEKAFRNLSFALPRVLKALAEKSYTFRKIDMESP